MKYLNTGTDFIIMFEDTSTMLIYKKSLLNFTGGLLVLVDMAVAWILPFSHRSHNWFSELPTILFSGFLFIFTYVMQPTSFMIYFMYTSRSLPM
jgi:hypothetical protein